MKNLVNIEKIKGKKVIAKNGMMIGKVEDVELNDSTWAIKTVDVKLEDNVAKLYGEKSGIMKKSIVPLPGNLMGPIEGDTIYLNEKISDVESLRDQVETKRSIM